MRNYVTLIVGLLVTIATSAQRGEFEIHSNGLIYSEETMNKLTIIVDSLNQEFKSCDFNTVFTSLPQTIGFKIEMSEGNLRAAAKDMKKQISLADFIVKYPEAKVDSNVLLLKYKETNEKGAELVELHQVNLRGYSGNSITTDAFSYADDFTNKWVIHLREKTEYSPVYLRAFFIPKDFSTTEIPEEYRQMIGYSECLIDTNTTKLNTEATYGRLDVPGNWSSLSKKKKEKLLDKLRNTQVVGSCSMDNSPRQHAMYISVLSAETFNWSVFLKAHLDIMNDRFSRMSDGSWAWASRGTYVKELEELNIDVPDLLLGISFRVENAATNHYYGSISRLGRALVESESRKEIEQTILTVIANEKVDDFNRILFYYLFLNYNNNLDDEVKEINNTRLAEVVKTLPEYVIQQLQK